MSKPFFSICIPVYNMVGTIGASIESVLKQTCDDWELIIVDDCSADGTWELLQRKYSAHPKISLYRNVRNLKQWGNLNRCLELASGDWLGLLPADDTYRLHALETIKRQVVAGPDVILWAHAHLCHGEGIIPNIVPVYNQVTEFTSEALAELLYLKGNLFGELSSYFVRISTVHELNLKVRDCKTALDYDFWVRLLHDTPGKKCIYWPDVLTTVLQHDGSGSSDWIRSGANQRMVLDSIGELGALGWSSSVIRRQRLRALAFFAKRFRMIPGNRWELLLRNLRSMKVRHR
jgi:glycosyltransferase involved in cell wall biosynthesis